MLVSTATMGWVRADRVLGIWESETDDGKFWPMVRLEGGSDSGAPLTFAPTSKERAEAICNGLADRVNYMWMCGVAEGSASYGQV